MTHQNAWRGFTLIELLVVVLIVAILSAIALPRYQRAVEKSNAAPVITFLKAINKAQNLYHLEYGGYNAKFSELVVDLPCTKKYSSGLEYCDTPEWRLHLYRDVQNRFGIYASRLSGRYKGCGFIIWANEPAADKSHKANQLYCREPYSWETERGSYCQTIFSTQSYKGCAPTAGCWFEMP